MGGLWCVFEGAPSRGLQHFGSSGLSKIQERVISYIVDHPVVFWQFIQKMSDLDKLLSYSKINMLKTNTLQALALIFSHPEKLDGLINTSSNPYTTYASQLLALGPSKSAISTSKHSQHSVFSEKKSHDQQASQPATKPPQPFTLSPKR
jgi:hypothetical protein